MKLFSKNKGTEPKEKARPPIPGAGDTIVSKSILEGTAQLKWLFRRESNRGNGWVAFGDTDTQAYVDDTKNLRVVDFNTLAKIEPAILDVFYMPAGTDLELRKDRTGTYFVDTKTGKEIREQVKHPAQVAFEKNLKFLNQKEYPLEFFQGLFQKNQWMETTVVGEGDFPTGEMVLADPLAYLGGEYQTCLDRMISPGRYPIQLSVLRSPLVGLRVAAARLRISEKPAVRYEIAMPKGKTLEDFGKPKVWTFFGVDTGLACVTDLQIGKEYQAFQDQWRKEHPQKNLYQEYFQPLFQKSYEALPEQQNPGGSFLLWRLPQTQERLVLFSSGMGDGIYSGYWGLDGQEEAVELVIPFLNPEFFL